ncbi:MAG: ABC transporter ATP-binding protein [Gemmatimonadota bacterium]|nr:ABC transporter ATP-binding protein [Gemmatimonadota bacterium]
MTLALAGALAAPSFPRVAIRLAGLGKVYPVRRGWRSALIHPRRIEYARVLQNVSCDIGEGEFFGLLGPNGAGKTSLFKILATLIIPDEGSATVSGHDVVEDGAAVRRLLTPVIADERSLHWRLSARENLRLYASLHGLRSGAATERVLEVLEVVGLSDAGNKIVGSFSSGMKQRLLIARALVSRPRVLLLDEPTRSLDPVAARAFRAFLREEVSGRQGCTILLATHNAEEALELCDRIAILDRGRLLAVGKAEELSVQYAGERYRLWTKDAGSVSLAPLVDQGVVRRVEMAPDEEDGWTRIELEIPGGLDRAAMVVHYLSVAGMSIARFERISLSLADLIERIVAAPPEPAGEGR